VGSRINLNYTRAMLQAALTGKLNGVPFRTDPVFGVAVPTTCPGVPAEVLDPKAAWTDKTGYDRTASEFAKQFQTVLAKIS
jgi:phosphoenolpyruvate carboxykinase (ATP)